VTRSNIMQYSLGVSWIAVAEINGSAPSEDSRKHKFAVGVDSPLRRSKEFGQEARVTTVYLMQDWARGRAWGRARGWTQHRSEAWFPSRTRDAMLLIRQRNRRTGSDPGSI